MIAGQPTLCKVLAGEGEFFMLDEALLTKFAVRGFRRGFHAAIRGSLVPLCQQ